MSRAQIETVYHRKLHWVRHVNYRKGAGQGRLPGGGDNGIIGRTRAVTAKACKSETSRAGMWVAFQIFLNLEKNGFGWKGVST